MINMNFLVHMEIIMKKLLAAVTVLACGATAPAFAQDEAVFGGPYIGVQVSAARLQDKHTDLDYWYHGVDNFGMDETNAMGGIRAGYDYVSGSLIAGVLAEVNFGSLNTFRETTPVDPSYAIGAKIKTLGSVRAKLGVTSGKLAAFVTGGVAFADTKHRYLETDTSGEAYYEAKGSRTGYVLGVGAAYALNQHSSIGLDVSRYQFDSKTHELLGTGNGGSTLNAPWDYFFRQKDNVETIALSYSYRF